jgi:hypothetical protein
MEKNSKEHATSTHRWYFAMKALSLVLFAVVLVLLAVVAKNIASLKDLDNRLNALEEEKALGFKSLRRENHESGTTRSKRRTYETKFDKAMFQLRQIEDRYEKPRWKRYEKPCLYISFAFDQIHAGIIITTEQMLLFSSHIFKKSN